MRFITNNKQIECVRNVPTGDGESTRDCVVVSFDDNQNIIPAHVEACLTVPENKILLGWLKERALLTKKLENESVEETVLDALPALLSRAQDALIRSNTLDLELHRKLKSSLQEFDNKLNLFHPLTNGSPLVMNKMQEEEVLKEKLNNIRDNL
jgi:hypothetical protein